MKDGFIRCAASSVDIALANPQKNALKIIDEVRRCEENGVKLLAFPELCLTGYSCGDLFFNASLIESAKSALIEILDKTEDCDVVFAIGLPVLRYSKLYDCAALCHKGQLLGIVPKCNIPSSQRRIFTPGKERVGTVMYDFLPERDGMAQGIPFSASMVFGCRGLEEYKFSVEIGEDLTAPSPVCTRHTEAGAKIILCLASSPETVGAVEHRRLTVSSISARLHCGYVYANSSSYESVQDCIYSSHSIIAEGGEIIAEKLPFSDEDSVYSEIDVKALSAERGKDSTYSEHSCLSFSGEGYYEAEFEQEITYTALSRNICKNPFIPYEDISQRAELIENIQAHSLARRISHVNAKRVVIGISGGLDSTLALLVCVKAMDILGRKRDDVIAVTMPCFGTTERTKGNAEKLCNLLGVDLRYVNITKAVKQHFEDIGQDENVHDAAYENSQARERTQVLMDISNMEGGFVVGTGDLSELALGWCTYNGDHMSMYAVNADIPKTLVKYIVGHEAKKAEDAGQKELSKVLFDIVNTPVSPELLPPKDGQIAQVTEDIVGPYELHDFYIYYTLRYGFSSEKIIRLAKKAYGEIYAEDVIVKWYNVFVKRFFSQQFKRSCMPDGPRVGSVALSPRGAWIMPTDADGSIFLK